MQLDLHLKSSRILVLTFVCKNSLVIRVKDSGVGIPKDFDIFALLKGVEIHQVLDLGYF